MSTLVRTLGGLCRRRVVAFVETLLVLLALGAAPCFAEELTGYAELTAAQQDTTTDNFTGETPAETSSDALYERVNLTLHAS